MFLEGHISSASDTNYGIASVNKDDFIITEDGELKDRIYLISLSSAPVESITKIINDYYEGILTLNDIQSILALGDSKKVTLNAIESSGTANNITLNVNESHRQQNIELQIIDFDHDELTTPIGEITKALITVDQKNCLMSGDNVYYSSNTEKGAMHTSTGSSSTLYTDCARYNLCNAGYFSALPNLIQSLIKIVNKKSFSNGWSAKITNDYCLLLSAAEISTSFEYNVESQEGNIYAYYNIASSNKKKKPIYSSNSSLGSSLLLRTRYYGFYTSCSFKICNYSSYAPSSEGTNNATTAYGLAPAFCL